MALSQSGWDSGCLPTHLREQLASLLREFSCFMSRGQVCVWSLGRNRTATDCARPSSRFVQSAFADPPGLAKNESLLVRQLQTPTFLFGLLRREWQGFHMAQISTPQK